MKKQVKFLIVMGCMLALGILLCIVGVALGGSLAEASITQDKFGGNSKKINKTFDGEDANNIKNLVIDVSAVDITLKSGNAFSIRGNGINKCEVKGGTWYITSRLKNNFLFRLFSFDFSGIPVFSNNKREITITIPENYPLDEITIDASAIHFQIEALKCENLEIDASAGSIKMEHLESGEADIALSAGDVKINSFNIRGEADIDCSMGDIKLGSENTRSENVCNELSADCSMGDIKYYGKLTGENELDVSMGSIKLELTGKAAQYDFSTDATMGDINSSEVNEPSSDQSLPIYGTGDLSCSMGDITVNYHGEE